MSTVEQIVQTLQGLPEDRQREVLDFAEFLGSKAGEQQLKTPADLDLKAMKLGAWPKACTFRREDIYGDDGR